MKVVEKLIGLFSSLFILAILLLVLIPEAFKIGIFTGLGFVFWASVAILQGQALSNPEVIIRIFAAGAISAVMMAVILENVKMVWKHPLESILIIAILIGVLIKVRREVLKIANP